MNNLMVLDDMCVEHVEHEASIASAVARPGVRQTAIQQGQSNDMSIQFHQTPNDDAGLFRVRNLVMYGNIEEALRVANEMSPGAFQDPDFQLDIKLHQLDELIHATYHRHGARASFEQSFISEHDYSDALNHARTILAPYAQEAFPEAVSSNAILQTVFLCDCFDALFFCILAACFAQFSCRQQN
jgi:hypothetical protein